MKQHNEANHRRRSTDWAIVGGLILATALSVGLLLAYTPLRDLLPATDDGVKQEEIAEMQGMVAELSELVEAQDLYIENLKRTVLGEALTVDSVRESPTGATVNRDPLPPSAAELALRREMEDERNGRQSTPGGGLTGGESVVSLAQLYLVAPVNGEISAGFNLVNDHLGVDILAPQNTAIKATRDGVVFMSEFTNSYGNVIGIQHDNNLISFYKHNSRLLKQVGDRVKAGEAIAIIGDTGTLSSGPHLHFELWQNGRAVDPGEYVGF